MEVFILTEDIDIETQRPRGVFSTAEKARDAIRALTHKPRFSKDEMHARERGSGSSWDIDPYTLDEVT